jgi:hypothetical protein
MRTTWKIEKVKKTNSDEDYTVVTFKDYLGTKTVKLDNPRHFLEDLDKTTN